MMPRPRIPDIELLLTFAAVHRHRNFSAAAGELNLTQSAVSHRIRRLEEELGYVLFDRSPHSVVPTRQGSGLLRAIEPALSALDRAFAAQRPAGRATSLEIEVEPAFSTRWLAPRLKDFLRQHPAASLHINLSDKTVEFAGETEIAVKWGKGAWPGFACERLMGLTFTPMCSPHSERPHRIRTPVDIAECVLLHDRNYDAWCEWAEIAGLDPQRFRSGHVIHDTTLLEQTTIEGDGIAMYALELGHAALRRGDLVQLFPHLTLASSEGYHVLTRVPQSLGPLARAFIAWLKAQVAADIG